MTFARTVQTFGKENNMIQDNDGLHIGKAKRGIHFVLAPDGEFHGIPKSVDASELFDDSEDVDQEVKDFATACLETCDIAVIGLKDNRITGSRHITTKKITPAVIRKAARLAVQSGWTNVLIAARQELPDDARDAAPITFDVCLVKFALLIV